MHTLHKFYVSRNSFLQTFVMETLHTIGLGTLFFQILPSLDAVKGAMLTNCLCIVPAILQFFARTRNESRRLLKFILDMLALAAQVSGVVLWPLALSEVKDFWLWPLAFVLASIPWWENYLCRADSSFAFVRSLATRKERLRRSRYITYLFISLWKGLLMLGTMTAWGHYTFGASTLYNFTSTPFRHSPMPITTLNTNPIGNTTTAAPSTKLQTSLLFSYISLWVFVVQVVASYVCYQTAKFACKIGMQRFSFAFPLSLTVPVVVSVLITICGVRANNGCFLTSVLPETVYWTCFQGDVVQDLFFRDQTWVWILWLFSQTWITLHIWMPKAERLAKTDRYFCCCLVYICTIAVLTSFSLHYSNANVSTRNQPNDTGFFYRLFITPMYEGLLVDQSLALNRRLDDDPDVKVDVRISTMAICMNLVLFF